MAYDASKSSGLAGLGKLLSASRRSKRVLHIIILVSILFLYLVAHLAWIRPFHHHRSTCMPPHCQPEVHGKPAFEAPKFLYPLNPFPSSPMIGASSNQTAKPNPWLAAVISPASDASRRMLIRSTWMQLYQDVPFDARFVVSNPGPMWTSIVAAENRTFGDLIVLDHLQEDDLTANTIKTLEFLKWLVDHDQRYAFVSKLDTDLFLNAKGMWDKYLHPHLSYDGDHPVATMQKTILGNLYYSQTHDMAFPHGSMYTYTWDLVEHMAALQARFQVRAGEDMAMGILLRLGEEQVHVVNMNDLEKFDFDESDTRGDGTAWAREGTHPLSAVHAVYGKDVIAVHQLKKEHTFLKVFDCFDESGIKDAPVLTGQEQGPPFIQRWNDWMYSLGLPNKYGALVDKIPDFLWRLEENGDWVCDDTWNVGKRRLGGAHSS